MFDACCIMQYFEDFFLYLKLSILAEEERADCFFLSLFFCYLVALSVMYTFLTVQWVGLQCAIVVFPSHARLLFGHFIYTRKNN